MTPLSKILIILILLSGCINRNPEPSWKTFTIKKGNHYSKRTIRSATSQVSFKADLSNAIYDTLVLGNDKYDWNKLYGFSGFNNHENSWRIGFRLLNGRWEYAAYYYVDGVRGFQYLGESEINEQAGFKIAVSNGECLFSIDQGASILIGSQSVKHYYRSFPYFGGNQSAPNNMTIKIFERK